MGTKRPPLGRAALQPGRMGAVDEEDFGKCNDRKESIMKNPISHAKAQSRENIELLVLREGNRKNFSITENQIAEQVIDAAFKIHKKLGPGLLETVYEAILAYELRKRGLNLQRQVPVRLIYDEIQ